MSNEYCVINGRTITPLREPSDLTAAWLSKFLDRRISSDGFRVSAVGTGQMSSTVRVNFHEEGGQPESVIVKFASTDEGTRQLGKSLGHYMNEAIFFRRFGKLLEAGLPKCYGAIVDQDAFFTILLEDMGLHGGYQGDNIAGCSVEEAEMALDCLAKLQAPVLNSPELANDPWLNAPPLITEKMFRDSLPIYIKRYPPSEEHQRFLWWLADNVDNWRNDQRPPYAIFHGDARLDNFIYMKDRCVACDWGGLQWASALRDVCYFLGNGLLIPTRRKHEESLVRGYMDNLAKYSGQALEWDHIWTEYRRQTLYGVLQHISAGAMLPYLPRGEKMFKTLVERQSQHSIDLDTMSLVKAR